MPSTPGLGLRSLSGRLAAAVAEARPGAVAVTYRDGSIFGYVGRELRLTCRIAEIDPKVLALLIATEDRRFYEHFGIDLRAMLRALAHDLLAWQLVEGGSTLTQQLLKNTVFADWPPLRRKLAELLVGPLLECFSGKRWILEQYINCVYMGAGVYGFRSAARAFLGKEPQHLTWSEAALLAGLPAAPEAYAFCRPNPLAQPRRDFVLRAGARLSILSTDDLDLALREPLPPARYLVAASRDSFVQMAPYLPSEESNCVVTTLDRDLQVAAARIARRAAVDDFCSISSVELGSGAIRAAITRWPRPDSGFDVSLARGMSPGSALKPFVLGVALESGYSLADRFESGPVSITTATGAWQVENWQGARYGTPNLREATLLSDNTVYARLINKMGDALVAELMHAYGLPAVPSPGPTVALGVLRSGVSPVDVAASYAAFTDSGHFAPPILALGRAHRGAQRPELRLSAMSAAQVRAVLSQVVWQRSHQLAAVGAWGKTGTPDDGRSGWFVGVRGKLATAVVLGAGRGRGQPKAYEAQRIWVAFQESVAGLLIK